MSECLPPNECLFADFSSASHHVRSCGLGQSERAVRTTRELWGKKVEVWRKRVKVWGKRGKVRGQRVAGEGT